MHRRVKKLYEEKNLKILLPILPIVSSAIRCFTSGWLSSKSPFPPSKAYFFDHNLQRNAFSDRPSKVISLSNHAYASPITCRTCNQSSSAPSTLSTDRSFTFMKITAIHDRLNILHSSILLSKSYSAAQTIGNCENLFMPDMWCILKLRNHYISKQ